MAGHSRPKDGVLSHAYVPAIPIHLAKLCAPKRDHRDKPGDDGIAVRRQAFQFVIPGRAESANPESRDMHSAASGFRVRRCAPSRNDG